MIVQAGNGCYLTQSAEVPMKERVFRTQVVLRDPSEISEWKEVTGKSKDEMLAEASVIDLNDMDVDSIRRVGSIVAQISERINDIPMSIEESLELADYFPKWSEGVELAVGKKVSYDGSLFEVLQEHISQADWNPRSAVSLFKVVQVESEGTESEAIAWEPGMELEEGKHYTDNGITYICIRSSGIALHYPLDVLIGNYVEIINEQ